MMPSNDFFSPPPDVVNRARDAGLILDPEIWNRIGHYLALVREAALGMNLVSAPEPNLLWRRHALDSLTLLKQLEPAETVADIGSGAGFPGLPLAIALPDSVFTLIESTGKKARFLESCVENLGLGNVRVMPIRAEEAGHRPDLRERFSTVTGRAVASLNRFLEYALPLSRLDGRVLAMKGASVKGEIEEASGALTALHGVVKGIHAAWPDDMTYSEGSIVEIRKTSPTPARYPRPAQQIKKRPL